MNKPIEVVQERVVSTALSVQRLWLYVALIASVVSIFGNSAFQLLMFQSFVGLYRYPANVIYNALQWPYPQLVRDLTTLAIVCVVIAALKLNHELKTYRATKAALIDNEKAALATLAQSDDEVDMGGAIASGTLFGLILGGPIGAIIGAAAGGLLGAAASQEKTTPSTTPEDLHAAVQSKITEGRRSVLTNTANRVIFAGFVGLLVIALDWKAKSLIDVLSRWDDRVVFVAETLAENLNSGGPALPDSKVDAASPGAEEAAQKTPPVVGDARPAPAPRPEASRPRPTQRTATDTASRRPTVTPDRSPATPSQVAPISPPTVMVRYIKSPVWVRQPNSLLVRAKYPTRALRRGIDGRVVIDCLVTDDGSLSDCTVASENPSEQGFAEATLMLASRFRLSPIDGEGQRVSGARIRVPIVWQAEDK